MKNRKCLNKIVANKSTGVGSVNRKFLMKNCDRIFSKGSLRREQVRVGRGKELSYIPHQ